MFRLSNSLFGIIFITAVGLGVSFMLGNPPERTTFDSENQTCVFSDFRDNKISITIILSYVILIFFQGKCLMALSNIIML